MHFSPSLLCTGVAGGALAMTVVLALAGPPSHAVGRHPEISITDASSVAERLAAYQWKFVKAESAEGRELPEFSASGDWSGAMSMRFSGEDHGGMGVCNSIGWRYTLIGDSGIRFEQFLSTSMACDGGGGSAQSHGVMALEERVIRQLQQVSNFSLSSVAAAEAPGLTLGFADGSRWSFSGRPTRRTQYGDDKQQLLVEVAAERTTCGGETAATDAQKCIRLREVRWDQPNSSDPMGNARVKQLSLNLKEMFTGLFDWKSLEAFSYTGPWQVLPADAIEGFKHTVGSRTLEYVTRYRLHHQPKAAPDFVYIHESRMAPRSAP